MEATYAEPFDRLGNHPKHAFSQLSNAAQKQKDPTENQNQGRGKGTAKPQKQKIPPQGRHVHRGIRRKEKETSKKNKSLCSRNNKSAFERTSYGFSRRTRTFVDEK